MWLLLDHKNKKKGGRKMALSVPQTTIDAMLAVIADNANELVVCSAEPTTYTEAHTTYKLADVVLTEGDGNGDFTIEAGDGGGSSRKLTIEQQASIEVDVSDDATHVALTDTGNSVLYLVTTCTNKALTSGGTVTVPEWRFELGTPAAP
jgi:hypothetical protein